MDFSGIELLVIIAVIILVVGPQDIPKIMLTIGRLARRVQYIKYAFSQQFEDFLKEHDLEELRQNVNFEAPEGAPPADEAAFDEAAIDSDDEQDKERDHDRAAG